MVSESNTGSTLTAAAGLSFSFFLRLATGAAATGSSGASGAGSVIDSRSRAICACAPMRLSSASLRLDWRRSRQPSNQPPMRSASPSQENRNAQASASSSTTIHSTPLPTNPSRCMLDGPSTAPSTPPACAPATTPSNWYRRVHSRAVLDISSSSSPTQVSHCGRQCTGPTGSTGARSARSRRATIDSQARTPNSSPHHADRPNSTNDRSDAQAPITPAWLRRRCPSPEVENAASPGW